MAQEAAEIYMEHVPGGLQHDVVIVSVTDAQDVRSHTAASAGVDEVLHSLWRVEAGGGAMASSDVSLSRELQQHPAPACCSSSSYTKAQAYAQRNTFPRARILK